MLGASLTGWLRRRRRRRRFNPYIVGAPVFERQLFFGRASLVEEAVQALRRRSVVLRGERRIGKTSFLHQLRGRLEHDASSLRSYPVFVDLQVVTTRDLLRTLVEEATEALAVPASAGAPSRCARAVGEYRASDLRSDLERLVDAQRQRVNCPVRLVFLIDEVDATRDQLLLPAWAEFARVVAKGSEQFRAVLAGVEPAAVPAGDGQAGFGELQALELTPLARPDAEALVREPVAGAYAYTDRAVERILDTSRLRPCAIQALCRRAVDRMLDDGRRTVRALDVDVEARGVLFSEPERSVP